MKKTLTILFAVLTASVFAIVPQKMSYQAVVRNSSNALVVNSNIGMQVSILQGSATGTSVYVERQFTTTNANGLVTMEIGSGTIISGSFSTIDWSTGTYFIKTETDLNGGANYTITGTSQLLSVPYSLNAKTADNAIAINGTTLSTLSTGILKNTTTTGVPSIAIASDFPTLNQNTTGNAATVTTNANLTGDITSTGNATIIANKVTVTGTAPISITGSPKFIATSAVAVSIAPATTSAAGSMSATDKTKLDGTSSHYIGELFSGGIVVAVWKINGIEGGLIASLTDVSTGTIWSNVNNVSLSTALSPIDGQSNTNAIIAQIGHTTSAALTCKNYTGGGFNDWYLPAIWELNQCYNSAFIVNTVIGSANGFQPNKYWSSTDTTIPGYPWVKYFSDGSQKAGSPVDSKDYAFNVRAVRKF